MVMPRASTSRVPLAAIKQHPDLQIRGGTDFATVRRYAQAMRRGETFPAIDLAHIGPNLYIIDGHHRFEAAQLADLTSIDATSRRMSLKAAIHAAFRSNQAHGRSLTQREKQHAFQQYLELGLHLDDQGHVKPLRQIAQECPVYAFQTIARKLIDFGVRVPRDDVGSFRLSVEEEREWLSEDDIALEQESLLSLFQQHLNDALEAYGRLDTKHREIAFEQLARVIRDLENPLAI